MEQNIFKKNLQVNPELALKIASLKGLLNVAKNLKLAETNYRKVLGVLMSDEEVRDEGNRYFSLDR